MNESPSTVSPTARHTYRYAGLAVVSDIDFPELDAFRCDEAMVPDVAIAIVDSLGVDIPEGGWITPTEYRFCVEGVGDYRVSDGVRISVAPVAGAGMRELRLFVLGSAWAALAHQRGLLFLHASAVRIGERAVAFCGASGAGKSTACALMMRHGGQFIGDDLCRFRAEPELEAALVYASSGRLKLWHDGLEHFAVDTSALQRDHFRADKYLVPVAPAITTTAVALGAICLLEWGEERCVRLSGRTAVRRLLEAATYRPYLLEPMGLVASHWQQCLELASRVPVFELRRARTWDSAARTVECVTRMLNGTEP